LLDEGECSTPFVRGVNDADVVGGSVQPSPCEVVTAKVGECAHNLSYLHFALRRSLCDDYDFNLYNSSVVEYVGEICAWLLFEIELHNAGNVYQIIQSNSTISLSRSIDLYAQATLINK
jgi:hypothetical protein